MLALERRRVGPLTIDRGLVVDEVAARHALGRLGDDVLSLDRALDQLGIVVVDEHTVDRVRHGVPVPIVKILHSDEEAERARRSYKAVRIQGTDGRLVAIGKYSEASDSVVNIDKVLVDQDV
jgi:tRNA U55 pseudouridine synthase TruB